MARSIRLALAALSVAALSTTVGSALADASPAGAPFRGCSVELGTKKLTLPSNAPALLVGDQSEGASASVSAELVTTDGRAPFGPPTKDAHGLLVVALPKASVGTHSIATTVVCSDGSTEKVQATTLELTAPVDLPTSVGTLTLEPNPTPRGSETITLTPSPALRAFEPITVLELSVNGAAPGGGRIGNLASQLQVNTGSVCVENGALHRDKRTVRVSVSAHLAGVAESPESASLDILVDCGAIRWTTDKDFDGATPTTETSSGTTGSKDGNGTSTSSAGGCSAAPRGRMTGGSAAFAAGTALAMLAAFRRRRGKRGASTVGASGNGI